MTKDKEEHKNLKNRTQPMASSLNIDFNFDGGACQKVTPSLEERLSLAKKITQWLHFQNTCWKEMLGICSFNPKIFTNKEAHTCICI